MEERKVNKIIEALNQDATEVDFEDVYDNKVFKEKLLSKFNSRISAMFSKENKDGEYDFVVVVSSTDKSSVKKAADYISKMLPAGYLDAPEVGDVDKKVLSSSVKVELYSVAIVF